jgi:hypothetical protein
MGSTELPGQRLDRSALCMAIEVADQAVAGRPVPRARYAELVAQLYEALRDGWPVGGLVPYARALAERMSRDAAKRPPSGGGRLEEA